jgi:hypothetical protein
MNEKISRAGSVFLVAVIDLKHIPIHQQNSYSMNSPFALTGVLLKHEDYYVIVFLDNMFRPITYPPMSGS